MSDKTKFIEELNSRYQTKGASIILGKGMLDGAVLPEVNVSIPLKTVNRHGLIAGATGTGKTKTLQVFVEQLSHAGVPSLVMDIKGDLSGIAVADNPQGKKELADNYGAIAPASLGAILRSIVALEQQGASQFFGEPSFDVQDLLQLRDGKGVVNVLRVADLQSKPALFSTFMLSLFAEIYMTFPEEGDLEKPKLVLFIDEAHLIFNEASKALLSQIETMVKLIRSKGVGIYFITQIPGDVPENVLSQLGMKIQHALRGFTAKDRKEIDKAIENYPMTEYYKAGELIQALGIGEAFITALDEKGVPTPLVHTYLISPESRMDVLSASEIDDLVNNSHLASKYNQEIDKESAYEILMKRMNQNTENEEQKPARNTPDKEEPGMFETVLKSPMAKTFGNTLMREGAKAILGMLGLKTTRRR